MKVACYFCKKEFTIDFSDSQYLKIKKNPEARYVCKSCNRSMQQEAQQTTGLHPDTIDKYDKFFR
ncbi:DUF2197 domain-containing protein [Virgibacillus senegalensis]|uniref:DUF2197 domain-containing protein n=1 Tax=Virgibacillus senegalensis TaxID=1499679 RepID=UPI00069DB667|nr:DUF2197 domain-containing protein [Virgibacillus senegalensis]